MKGNAYLVPSNFNLSDIQPVVVPLQQALVSIIHVSSEGAGLIKEFAHITVINMLGKCFKNLHLSG